MVPGEYPNGMPTESALWSCDPSYPREIAAQTRRNPFPNPGNARHRHGVDGWTIHCN
jgi:hypothetical protein